MASGSETPALSMEERMRQTRSMIAVRTRSPRMGSLRMKESMYALPVRDRRMAKMAATTTMTKTATAHHQWLKKFEALSSILVGRGSSALKDLKNTTNFGITNAAKTMTTATAMSATTAGY